MINNNDVDSDMDDGEQDFDISFCYYIPLCWFICIIYLRFAGRSQQRAFREVAESRRSRDEPLVAEFIRSEIP